MSPTPQKPKRQPAPLPRPNVDPKAAGDGSEMTPEQVRALFCNPLYAGIAQFPQVIDDETWVRAASKAIREHGSEQWLVNMLHVLRHFLNIGTSGEE